MKESPSGGTPANDADDTTFVGGVEHIVAELEYDNSVEVVGAARDVVAERVANLLPDDRVEDVRLLTSELVANCVRHGRGVVGVVISTDDDHVIVTVSDRGDGRARIRNRPADGSGGYGLRLVEVLSDRWEQLDSDDGTTVRIWIRAS